MAEGDKWWHEHQADEGYAQVMSKAFEGVDLPLASSLIVEGSDRIRLLELP